MPMDMRSTDRQQSEERWHIATLALLQGLFIAGLVTLVAGLAEYWSASVSLVFGASLSAFALAEILRLSGKRERRMFVLGFLDGSGLGWFLRRRRGKK